MQAESDPLSPYLTAKPAKPTKVSVGTRTRIVCEEFEPLRASRWKGERPETRNRNECDPRKQSPAMLKPPWCLPMKSQGETIVGECRKENRWKAKKRHEMKAITLNDRDQKTTKNPKQAKKTTQETKARPTQIPRTRIWSVKEVESSDSEYNRYVMPALWFVPRDEYGMWSKPQRW